jgi:hypothetical protein
MKFMYVTFKCSVLTSQKTQCISITKINRLIMFREINCCLFTNTYAYIFNAKASGAYTYHFPLKR